MMDFETMLDEVVGEQANPVVPAGLSGRLLESVWAERMERRMAAGTVAEAVWHKPVAMGRVLQFDTVQRVKAGRSFRSTSFAVLAHVAALVLLALLVRSGVKLSAPMKVASVQMVAPAPLAMVREKVMGGGGGQKGPTLVAKGTPPRAAEVQIVPPMAAPVMAARIAVEPTIEMQQDVKMASALPQMGVANSPVAGISLGNGSGTGLGSGRGSGIGPGSGGNTGGGPKRVGGGVSAPVLVFQVPAEFSEEARRAKITGNVIVNLWVDAQGNPSHVRVVQGVGMGLDEKAIAAVKQYRFRPAMEGGKPVVVEVNVEVDFHIF